MKLLNTIALSFLIISGLYAQQSGIIHYSETMKLDVEIDAPAGIDLSEFLPESTTSKKELKFNKSQSIYSTLEQEEDKTISSDDGSIQIQFVSEGIDSKLYIDQSAKKVISQEGFMGKSFVIENKLESYKWKITPEKVKYLDYECIKATMTNEEDEIVTAWFAPAIPASIGPDQYGQLPGAILMLTVGEASREIKAIAIELKDIGEIKIPNDGDKVTNEEYEKIVEDKMKEMKDHWGHE